LKKKGCSNDSICYKNAISVCVRKVLEEGELRGKGGLTTTKRKKRPTSTSKKTLYFSEKDLLTGKKNYWLGELWKKENALRSQTEDANCQKVRKKKKTQNHTDEDLPLKEGVHLGSPCPRSATAPLKKERYGNEKKSRATAEKKSGACRRREEKTSEKGLEPQVEGRSRPHTRKGCIKARFLERESNAQLDSGKESCLNAALLLLGAAKKTSRRKQR